MSVLNSNLSAFITFYLNLCEDVDFFTTGFSFFFEERNLLPDGT
jgi:hypothetical protein